MHALQRRAVCGGPATTYLDGVEQQLGHSDAVHVDKVGLEEALWGAKPLATDVDDTAIGQLVSGTEGKSVCAW